MTKEFAIALIRTSVNVKDWNEKRETCKEELSPQDWEWVWKIIDHNGFIVKVLHPTR